MSKPYFNLEKVIEKYNIDIWSDSCILCINAIRNIGKTTNVLNFLMPKVKHTAKIGFIRNSEEQLKAFKSDFNARYSGKFMISGVMVWSLKSVTIEDKEGNEVTSFQKDQHVGYCASISTYTKIKSIEAANIRYILMDEYNEADLSIRDIYVKWINMVKTLSRFSKVLIIMLGNRDTPNNEFMVKWGVLPQTSLFHEDYYFKFSERGHFIELGSAQFDGLENDKTLVNELAKFDKDAKRYLAGGYAEDMGFKVVPFDLIIKPTFTPEFRLGMKGRLLVLGEFNHYQHGPAACLVEDEYALELAKQHNVRTYSLDSLSHQLTETKLTTEEGIYNTVLKIFRLHKKGKMYYDSFDILTDMTDKMTIIKF